MALWYRIASPAGSTPRARKLEPFSSNVNTITCAPRAQESAAPEDSAIVATVRSFQRSTFEGITDVLFEEGREGSQQISYVITVFLQSPKINTCLHRENRCIKLN